ncbi:DNA-binding MarR family transcriptional regulator [Paenibacillus polymyxa]
MDKLTKKEMMIMEAGRTNDYSDLIEGHGEWTFAIIDASGLDGSTARGVISSLVKKGYLIVTPQPGEVDSLTAYTEKGIRFMRERENAKGSTKPSVWVFNGESKAITVYSDGNGDIRIRPREIAAIPLVLNGETHVFNADSFFVKEPGDWYLKSQGCASGADVEIYNAK